MCRRSDSGCVLCVFCFGWMVDLVFEREQFEFGSSGDIDSN